MRLSLVVLAASLNEAVAQRKRPKKNKNNNRPNNRPKATQAPRLIAVPAQTEPGFNDNRQEIANMLAYKLNAYGYNSVSFTDVMSSGCWCNFINSDKRHGHPVGSMDTACRAHSHCYKCMTMDYACTEETNAYQVILTTDKTFAISSLGFPRHKDR